MQSVIRSAVRHRRPGYVLAVVSATLVLLVAYLVTVSTGHANAATTLLSQGKPTTASSAENAGTAAANATDGNTGTRWSSAFSDPQWVQVDLGASANITQVILNWETAYATAFQIQVSATGTGGWTNIFSTTSGSGGIQTLNVTGTGRFVRMNGTARATQFGYSLWEFQVFGDTGATTTCGTANAALNRPATASSVENATFPASAAVDGNTATRWSSAFSVPQWLQVDLGSSQPICQVVLVWEAAYATAFQIQTSNDATTWTSIFSTTTGTGGTQTLNVTGNGRYVRVNCTVRATPYGCSLFEFIVHTGTLTTTSTSASASVSPSSTGNSTFWGDTSTIPAAQNVLMLKILNRTNGKYPDSQVFWSYNGVAHSIAETPYFDMPVNSAGRMYFYLGSVNGPYFDFIEFTVGASVFNGNTTRVDAFGLKLAMRLHSHDGYDVSVGEDLTTFTEDRAVTFQKFVNEVPAEFKVLGQVNPQYRIIAPGSDPTFRAGGVNQNYFTAYAQSSFGLSVATSDVFGCAGVLGADPGRCAALNRHVAHLPQSAWSDPSQYYLAGPANYYAKFWHDHAINKLAYGFPYDDFAGQSSFISHGSPQWLEISVGW